jgi:ADP-ribose pyrophosphatase YjhB (NUDIX family)
VDVSGDCRTPGKDCWNLPAGYVEAHEAPLQAVVREVHEETGLRVEPQGLAGVYYFDDDPRGNGILIVYACRPVGGALRDTREGVASAFFGVNDLPEDLAGGGTIRLYAPGEAPGVLITEERRAFDGWITRS